MGHDRDAHRRRITVTGERCASGSVSQRHGCSMVNATGPVRFEKSHSVAPRRYLWARSSDGLAGRIPWSRCRHTAPTRPSRAIDQGLSRRAAGRYRRGPNLTSEMSNHKFIRDSACQPRQR